MIFVTHKIDHHGERAQADALRRYVREKAAGRKAPEYVYQLQHAGGIVALVRCGKDQTDNGKTKIFPQRFRKPGPWCETLGHDTSIADDCALMAFLEMKSTDDPKESSHEWSRLLREVSRDRIKAVRTFRNRGFEILARQARRQSSTALPPADAKALVSAKYAKRGEGVRPLKLAKTAQ